MSDSRGILFYDFVRAAKIIKPEWIIGENVKGIISRKNQDNSKYVKDIIVNEFENIGYHMYEPFVLTASDYGVSQRRDRCFFIGGYNSINYSLIRGFDKIVYGLLIVFDAHTNCDENGWIRKLFENCNVMSR